MAKQNFKHVCFCMGASVMAILSALPSFGAVNPTIKKLLTEKKQKMAQLEQCAQKVKGFKIAGISTLGLTAVGIGGNIALATKNAKLEKTINGTDGLNSQIQDEQDKIDKLGTQIAAEEQRVKDERKKAEEEKAAKAEAEQKAKELENKKTEEELEKKEKEEKDSTPQKKEKTSLQECLERRKDMSAEVRACCYVGAGVAKGDEKNQKCNCVNGGTFIFDQENISAGGKCQTATGTSGGKDSNVSSEDKTSTSGASGVIGTIGNACAAVDLPTGAKSGKYAYSSDTSKKKCYQSKSDKTVSECYCKADSCKTDEGYSLSGDKCIVEDENFAKDLKLDKCRKDLKELYVKFSSYKNAHPSYSSYLAFFCNRSGKEQEAKELVAVNMYSYPEKIRNIIEAPAASPSAQSCEVYNNFKKAYDDYNDYESQLNKTETKSINGTEYELYTVRSDNKRICYSNSTCVDFRKVCKIYGAEVKNEHVKNPCNIAYIQKYTCDCTKASGVTERKECEEIFGK